MPSPDSATPFLRHATRDDVPHIHSLIHLLAAYEHATSSVVATPASLTNTLSFPPFPSPGYARCMLLFAPSDAAQPAGMALYFFNYSTWRGAPGVYVEDLFVREEYRGRGYGGRLLAEMARVVKGVGGGRLEWSVLKWNEPSIRF
ncbi:MAG: hypothetical protein M1833_000162 [Piccolia ochrophora]|nr:MAG: hypothetical protein M1833_000162 [Piccolia ochrophora]